MNKEIIKSIIATFHQEEIPEYFQRDIEIPLSVKKVVTIIGPRRSGKTAQLFNLMHYLLADGVSLSQIIYINFEDERLNFSVLELDLILQAYLTLYPDASLQDCYFFFDEIQIIDGWDKFVRRLYDSISQHIFISGSNAKLLSSEIASSLRGRALSYRLLPLSFVEYCRFKKVSLTINSRRDLPRLLNNLEIYLEYGGFPELIDFDNDLKVKTLQEYFNTMMYRDMIERYDVNQAFLLKYFLKRLFASSGKTISVNKLFNEIKSSGQKLSRQKLYDYFSMAENIFMTLVLRKYSPTIVNQELAERKAYIIDTGLLNAVTYRFSKGSGRLIEHLVFQELVRRDAIVFFFKEKYECDFIVQQGLKIKEAIQVAYQLDEQATLKREVRGLLEACQIFGLKQGKIITNETERQFCIDGIDIFCVPLYKWLIAART